MTKARDLANGGFGLVLIKPSTVVGGTDNGKGTVSFSAASTVSLNDVFSSTYTNYKILFEITNCTVDGSLSFRMRTGGSDASGASTYLFTGGTYNTSGTASAYNNASANKVDVFDLDGGGSTASVGAYASSIELHNPNLSEYTVANILSSATQTEGTYRSHFSSFWHAVESPYTGFSIFHSSSGTITGQISVYGYNK